MGSVWFLGFHFLMLATVSSSNLLQDNKSQNLSNIHLNLYHATKPNSSLPTKSFFQDLLSNDQNRVNSLQSMLSSPQNQADIHTKTSSSSKPRDHKSVNIPLNPGISIGSGNYYVKIGLGSPAKYYPMVMDTGSSLSWLQCLPCAVYCHSQLEPVFDPSASSTYSTLSCGATECGATKRATLNEPGCSVSDVCIYTASYGDASYSIGYLSHDTLTLAPSQALPRFVYGCGQDNQGLFGLAAGLLGLARDRLSLIAQASGKYGNAFAYCLPSPKSGRGGFLSVGNTAARNPSAYKFTPMVTDPKNPSLYFLRLSAIVVGKKALAVSASSYRVPTIIDSGTVISRLPGQIYGALQGAFVAAVGRRLAKAPAFSILDTCYKAGSVAGAAATVPEVLLVFGGGAELRLRPENVLIEVDKGVVCLAFAANNEIAIIGNHQQQTFRVFYDVAKARIGFAPGGCS